MNGLFKAPFADGVYDFRMTIGGAEELEEKCNAGIPVILRRIALNECRVGDIRETVRLGLVGGGLAPEKALVLIQNYVERGIERYSHLAVKILSSIWFENSDPAPKSKPRGRKRKPLGETGA